MLRISLFMAAMSLAIFLSPIAAENGIIMQETLSKLETTLVAKHGEAARPRLKKGLEQAARFWRAEDGDAATFEKFVESNFVSDPAIREATFARLQSALEQYDGHMLEIIRVFRENNDLDRGTVMPVDQTLSGYDPSAHSADDFFENKLAFQVLLNFPLTSLEEDSPVKNGRARNGQRPAWPSVFRGGSPAK